MNNSLVTCPSCNQQVPYLKALGEALLKRLETEGITHLPEHVCEACYQNYAGKVAKGAILLAEFKEKEKKKLMMWKSRVNLLKRARLLMKERAYADAAIAYEKYLKVLETVYEVKSNQLTPEHLKDTARTQELTVIASVYWDLLRIYDTSDRYTQRMEMVGKKLSEFLIYTPILPDIVRKAQIFEKSAKKSHIVKSFLKKVTTNKKRCFIATATFESYQAPEVIILSQFRDGVLKKYVLGRIFIFFYYKYSPRIAHIIEKSFALKILSRWLIKTMILPFVQMIFIQDNSKNIHNCNSKY